MSNTNEIFDTKKRLMVGV